MCACDDSVSRTEKFRRSIDGLKAWCAYRLSSQKFCAQNDVFLGVRVSFVLCLTLDKQIGMCPHPGPDRHKILHLPDKWFATFLNGSLQNESGTFSMNVPLPGGLHKWGNPSVRLLNWRQKR